MTTTILYEAWFDAWLSYYIDILIQRSIWYQL